MQDLGQEYYDLGIKLFEAKCYEQAVKYWIQAYELGYERELILENLYACFILPNEQEFRNNYYLNSENLTQTPFEECALDFIPVSETRFYIYDKMQQEFLGVFEMEEEPVHGEEEEFESLLYTDTWDIREIIPDLKRKNWEAVFIVLNELEARFVSFLKLPRLKELYFGNVVIFKDAEEMCSALEEYEEIYLPKEMVSSETEKYYKLIQKLHLERIHNIGKERNNIFLSICIPSYNRGTSALKNVLHLLQCPYDNEIEIIVSNNGSTEDVEGYQEIQKIADARIQYHEFDENQGYAPNVLKTLELARGKYAVLSSDEDLMILERMGEYLSYLKANPTCGVCRTSGIGSNFGRLSKHVVYGAGMQAVSRASNENYITGVTYNMQLLKAVNALDTVEEMRGNSMIEYYVHIPMAMLIAKYADFHEINIVLWDAGEDSPSDNKLVKYMLPESRIVQQSDMLEILYKAVGIRGQEFLDSFLERMGKTYMLLRLAYILKFEKYKQLYEWEEICLMVHKANMEYLKEFPVELREGGEEIIKDVLQSTFYDYLELDEIILKFSLEEQEVKRSIHQMIKNEIQNGKDLTEIEHMVKEYFANHRGMSSVEKDIEGLVEDSFLKNTEE